MTDFGYQDPYEQAREARESLSQPGSAPWPQDPQGIVFQGLPGPLSGMQGAGPLSDVQNQVAGVLNAADHHHTYLPGPDGGMLQYPRGHQPSILGDMVKGALVGFGSALVWRRMRRRRQLKGEWTSPGFRALFLLLVFPVAGFALSMIWVPESPYFLGWGSAIGIGSFIAYAIYRAAGGGAYNTNRRGSPWREDHRR